MACASTPSPPARQRRALPSPSRRARLARETTLTTASTTTWQTRSVSFFFGHYSFQLFSGLAPQSNCCVIGARWIYALIVSIFLFFLFFWRWIWSIALSLSPSESGKPRSIFVFGRAGSSIFFFCRGKPISFLYSSSACNKQQYAAVSQCVYLVYQCVYNMPHTAS